jgi:hypothetical protein
MFYKICIFFRVREISEIINCLLFREMWHYYMQSISVHGERF